MIQKERVSVKEESEMFSKREIFKITLPLIVQQVLATTVAMVDSVMVSAAGETAVAGVSLVGMLDTMLVILFSSLVTGGSVVIAHAMGKGDKREMRDSVKQLLYVTTGVAMLVTLLVQLCGDGLLSLLYGSAEAAVLSHAHDYFYIISLSFPLLAIESAGNAAYRVMGKTTASLVISVGHNLVNIAGNAILIYGFKMGAAGAAIASVAARFVGAAIWIVMLHNQKHPVHVRRLFHYRPDLGVIKEILRIGVPGGFESAMFQFGRLLTQSLISTMGTAAIAANSVALNIANYQYIPGAAIGNAIITVVGRCVGAGEREQAKKNAHFMMGMSYVLLWALNLITLLFCRPLVGMYHLSGESSDIAGKLLLLHALVGSLLWPIGFVLPHVFRSAGDVRLTAIISPLSMWVFRVALGYVLAWEQINIFGLVLPGAGWGIYGVWTAMFIDWVFRCCFYLPHYLRHKWLKRI